MFISNNQETWNGKEKMQGRKVRVDNTKFKHLDKLRSAIYGLAVGDALGVPVEFMERGSFCVTEMSGYGSHNQPDGTWSDDTSMTLATCDSIRKLQMIDCDDIMKAVTRPTEKSLILEELLPVP